MATPEGRIESIEYGDSDSVKLFRFGSASIKPRATILGLHGFAANPENFIALSEWFGAQNINTIALEFRGFGHWEGPNRFDYWEFEHVVEDLKAVLEAHSRLSDAPIIFWGESLGSLIMIDYLLRSKNFTPVGAIFTAPFFLSSLLAMVRPLVSGFGKLMPRLNIPSKVDLHKITSDEKFIEKDRAIDLSPKHVSLRLLAQTLNFSKHVVSRLKHQSIPIPTAWLLGESDNLLNKSRFNCIIERFATAPYLTKTYPGGKHLLINDIYSELVFADALEFIDNVLSSGAQSLEDDL